MLKRKILALCLGLGLVALCLGIDDGWAQKQTNKQQTATNYEQLQEELAAKRAAQGQMKSTTPAQRKAAAQHLKATLGAQQSAPTSGGEVTK